VELARQLVHSGEALRGEAQRSLKTKQHLAICT